MSVPVGSTKSDVPTWAKATFVGIAFVLATVAVVWLSGALYFALHKVWPFGKTGFGTWWTYWSAYGATPVEGKKLKIALFLPMIPCYGAVLALVVNMLRDVRSLHGDARFATENEIEKAGLFTNEGILIGKLKNRYLFFSGMQFVMLCAPTRSGKGVAVVIPNLLTWTESVFVLDIKLENFLITSKFRAAHGHAVYLFNPFSITAEGDDAPLYGRTHRYNCLGYVSDDPRLRVTDILSIGYSLYPGDGKDAFFDDAARNLFLGLVLYLCETPSLPRTMGELLRQSSGKGQPIKEYLNGIIEARNFRKYADIELNGWDDEAEPTDIAAILVEVVGLSEEEATATVEAVALDPSAATKVLLAENIKITDDKVEAQIEETVLALRQKKLFVTVRPKVVPLIEWDGLGEPMLSRECVDSLNRFINTSDNTLSSILATFNVPLTIWTSPVVDAATSANDFDLRDVRKKLMSIYFGVPANKLAEASLIINIFYTQLVTLNTDRLLHSSPELKYTCLMIDDEFTAPGRIKIIDKSNSFQAGYGMRLVTIVQSPGQLQADPPRGYGKEGARTLMTNHACQMLFPPREQQDANEYSEMLGYYTFKAKGRSRQLGGRGHGSESESDQRRALMLPQELKELDQSKEIITLENCKPIMASKVTYHADKRFMNRLKSVSPRLREFGNKLPTKAEFERIWGDGDLAAPVPFLDLELHAAVVEQRVREVKAEDVAKGIDLGKLAVDMSKVKLPAENLGVSPESVEDFVDSFFDALDAGAGIDDGNAEDVDADGSLEPASDDELAALDAEAASDADEAVQVAVQAWVTRLPGPVGDTPLNASGEATGAPQGTPAPSPAEDTSADQDDAPAAPGVAAEPALAPADFEAVEFDEALSLDDYEEAMAMQEPDFPDEEELSDEDINKNSVSADDSHFKQGKPLLDLSILDRPIEHP